MDLINRQAAIEALDAQIGIGTNEVDAHDTD